MPELRLEVRAGATLNGAGAAMIKAIYNATGVRIRNCPATPDKIIAGLPPVGVS